MDKKCPNCDFPILPEHKFCPSCSQRTAEKVTIRSLFANSIASYFSIDSRLLHTLLPLLIKPGKIAKDFIAGKRKTYLYPVQSYLFFSLMFLIVFELLSLRQSSLPGEENEIINFNTDSLSTDQDTFELDTVVNINSFDYKITHFGKRLDSLKRSGLNLQRTTAILTADDQGIWKFAKSQIIKITYSGSNSFLEAFLGNTPFTLLLFLPFLALFQYIFGNKKKWNVASHFVFHLYNLSFAFIVLLLLYIIDSFAGTSTIVFSLAIIPVYLFLALLHFYGRKVWSNILRFVLLSFFSLIIGLPIIFIGTLVITFLRY